jgi:uracil DNA glycosylase
MRVDIAKMFAGVDKDWIRVFTSDELGPLLTKVLDSLPEGCNITPSPNDIFNFARLTPYNKVKAVIVGQDPYYTEGCANGLAFSSNAKKIPPSLRNVYKCLYEQIGLDRGYSLLMPPLPPSLALLTRIIRYGNPLQTH